MTTFMDIVTISGILITLYYIYRFRQHEIKQGINETYPRRKELVQEAGGLGLCWGCTEKSATIILRKTSWYDSDITMTIQKAEKELVAAKAARYYSIKEELATKEAALTKWTEAASKLQNRINELEAGAMTIAGELDYYRRSDSYSITNYTQPPVGKKSGRKKK